MAKEFVSDDKKPVKRPKIDKIVDKQRPAGQTSQAAEVLHLQQQVGNQAVQRLIAQRSSEGAFDLDDDTAGRINQARGGGQPLDGTVQKQMGSAMGQDFSGVRVHTSGESDALNQQLSAKAFTTGQDIFFKQGEYNPSSSGGQELIAHELTHVVQQSSGAVKSGGSGMTVNAPGDTYEQEADSVAKQAVNANVQQAASAESVQRDSAVEEEEEAMQTKPDDVQREEEEEMMQTKPDDVQREEEEEATQMKRDNIQRADIPEEEELPPVQAKRDGVQRQGEEELL